MFEWVKHLGRKWSDWCGDHDMEVAIRGHLTDSGYFGKTAKLRNVRLVAVQRPGWLQVFRFEVVARVQPPDSTGEEGPDPQAEYRELFGLVREDLRHKVSVVRTFVDEDQRKTLFADWSQDLICLRGAHGLTVR
jgi:hypothetical protein